MDRLKDKLQKLYRDGSKHSGYQNVPDFVREALGYRETINEEWRGDTARYHYLEEQLPIRSDMVVGDVGCNTGFFTLSLAHAFKETRFVAYETNENHIQYIQLIVDHFKLHNISIRPQLVTLDTVAGIEVHDVIVFFNVLHHAGYDFDLFLEKRKDAFWQYARAFLQKLAAKTRMLVFQMGYNWGGDKKNPIIQREDDAGKVIKTAREFREAGWRIDQVAMARRNDEGRILYANLPADFLNPLNGDVSKDIRKPLERYLETLELDQFVGEFYRRPIFTCSPLEDHKSRGSKT